MKTDRVFVLLIVVLLPLSGCFDGTTTGDAEGAEGAEDALSTTIVNNYYNNSTNSNPQEKTWYSSGGTYDNYWDDNGVLSHNDANACKDWGPTYDQDTGEFLGDACRETGYRDAPEQWNGSECTDAGGDIVWPSNVNTNPAYYYRQAPSCSAIELITINTTPGEALLVYQLSGASMVTTCNGISQTQSVPYTLEYRIITGSALDCTHLLTYTMNYGTYDYQTIWSIVYAIQDVTVV